MNTIAGKDAYNEDFAVFFEGKLVDEADLVFRLAFSYTLNKKAALECVQSVYKTVVGDLPNFVQKTSPEIRKKLFEEALKVLKAMKAVTPSDTSLFAGFLKPFSNIERASLMMVEVGGVFPDECADILGIDEKVVRKSLSKARSRLIKVLD